MEQGEGRRIGDKIETKEPIGEIRIRKNAPAPGSLVLDTDGRTERSGFRRYWDGGRRGGVGEDKGVLYIFFLSLDKLGLYCAVFNLFLLRGDVIIG
jgi:hypothetical protein